MALLLTLMNGELVPGDKEKGLPWGFGAELRAGPKALLLPSWWVQQEEVTSCGTECEESCLLQSQLRARSAPHRSHLLGGGWQDEPSLASHGSSGFLHTVQPMVEGFCTQPLPVPQRRVTHFSCHSRDSAFPQRAPIPTSAGLGFLQTGRGTATGSPGRCCHTPQ